MSKEEKLEKLLSEVARIADYANICHSMPGTSAHDTHYRYIETRLLKAIREYKAPPNTACTPTGGGLVQADDESTLPATSG